MLEVVFHQIFMNDLDSIMTRLGYNAEYIYVDTTWDTKINHECLDVEILIINNKYFHVISRGSGSLVNNGYI